MIAMFAHLTNDADDCKKAHRSRADSLDSIDVDSLCATTTPEISDEDNSVADSDEDDSNEQSDPSEKFDESSSHTVQHGEGCEISVAPKCRIPQSSVPILLPMLPIEETGTFVSSLPSCLSPIHEVDEDEDDVDHRSDLQSNFLLPLKVVASSIVSNGKSVKCKRAPTLHDEPLKKRPLLINELPASLNQLEPMTIEVISPNEDSLSDFLRGLIEEKLTAVSDIPRAEPLLPMKVVASQMVSNGRKAKCKKAPTFNDEPLWKRPLLPDLLEGPVDASEPWSIDVTVIAKEDGIGAFF